MTIPTEGGSRYMHEAVTTRVQVDVLLRVHGEYMEMPGLRLTLAQASRLWHLERELCADVLETLVDRSFLRRLNDVYVRADSGRACA
jgi:hypothetical protein